VVGPLLFRQPPLTYLAFLLVVPAAVFLFRTRAGLDAARSGREPAGGFRRRRQPGPRAHPAMLGGGALAGLGGAVLSLQQVGTFTDGMTGGRGYLALAAIIVGRWMPLASLGGLPDVRRWPRRWRCACRRSACRCPRT
jgi:ABC-type uncharacterized transport system permease subunit